MRRKIHASEVIYVVSYMRINSAPLCFILDTNVRLNRTTIYKLAWYIPQMKIPKSLGFKHTAIKDKWWKFNDHNHSTTEE
jgi:hypothetical protein